MVKVVGIRFRNAGKIYYFGPGKLQLKAGMHAIVETARGVEMGTVMTDPREVDRKSTRLNSSHNRESRMPSSA